MTRYVVTHSYAGFAPGDQVEHHSYGSGVVSQIHPHGVTARFPSVERVTFVGDEVVKELRHPPRDRYRPSVPDIHTKIFAVIAWLFAVAWFSAAL